ncbi:MAG: hypothetical protein KatS3mg023_3386 [Armatimonadota bacterium]|nr:MAG: hypothetical protein KatS3mg023_3386 [Armatimonadota bacterium]
MKVPWWGQFWLRVLTWAFATHAPQIYGGNLAFVQPGSASFPLQQSPPSVRCARPVECRVKGIVPPARNCTVHRLSCPGTRVYAVCAPSARARVCALTVKSRCQVRSLVCGRATLPVSHRVLLCRHQPAVRARVRLLPKNAQTLSVQLRWHCRAQRATIQRFHCRERRSSRIWRVPMVRHAVPFERFRAEHRRLCREALQRAAKGYARVESVYYPVPAHAVARMEIDERRGVLYVHPRPGHIDADAACLWVVSGIQVADGRPVRALLKVI